MKASTALSIFFMVCLSGMGLSTSAQPIGEVYTAGTTWYDVQHTGTCGKMIGVDSEGFVHLVWTNSLTQTLNPRHVFYNVWDPATYQFLFLPGGCEVDVVARAGYASLAVSPEGRAYPAFHEAMDTEAHAACGMDWQPRECSFSTTEPAWISGGQYIWPIIAQTPDSVVHMVTTESAAAGGDPQRIFYSRGIPRFDQNGNGIGVEWQNVSGDQQFMYLDSCVNISVDVAASRHSNRVVMGWAHNRDNYTFRLDNDALIKVSEDGGQTWGPNVNITNFAWGDFACCDTAFPAPECFKDTFRLYTDMSLLLDNSDVIHAAFTAIPYYTLQDCPDWNFGWIDQAGIWHWSEETHNFSLIASAFYFPTVNGQFISDGNWQTNVQRPSLAIDTSTGYLYCSYLQYDSNCTSNQGYPMADVVISVSTDNGAHWSVGTNVTRTCPGENIPPPGSMNEREATLAELVTDGHLHLSYVLDHDAGASQQGEGTATLNEFMYQRIPVDSIPALPLIPNMPIHADSTGFVKATEPIAHALPREIQLNPAYPNPFNSSTTISFDLPGRASVDLKVYNLLGQEVATLVSGNLAAGVYRQTWSPIVASGLYFVRLQAGNQVRTQKLMYLR